MTVQQSTQIKGIAILMMLWLHLFMAREVVEDSCISMIHLDGQPLPFLLKKICSSCVAIYAFLSGYGLTYKYRESGNKDIRDLGSNGKLYSFRRVARLYINYLVVFFIAFGIGYFVKPELFADAYNFLTCLLTLGCSYNGAWWFLCPYIILVLLSRWIIGFMTGLHGKGLWLAITAIAGLHVLAYLGTDYLDEGDILQLAAKDFLNTLYLLFPFTCGVIYSCHDTEKHFAGSTRTIVLAITVLCILKLSIGASALFNTPFVLLLIPLTANLNINSKILQFLGRHSTNMWLCHYFFIGYIASGEIYLLRYPIVIYLMLVALSLIVSIIIRPIVLRLTRF